MNRPILSSNGGRWLAAALIMLLGATQARAGLNQWTSNGPSGGPLVSQVTAVAIDPQTPATLYAGTQGGVFKSADGGSSWAASSTGLTNLLVNALAIGAGTPVIIYAGTSGGGVFGSINAGASWAPANTGLTNSIVSALAVDPTAPNVLYAGTDGGVFKSADSGASWTAANNGITAGLPIRGIAVDPHAPGTLYAATSGGVFKSTTGGTSWSAMNNGLGPTQRSVRTVAIDPQTTASLYAGTTQGVFQSPDGGGSWAPTGAGISETSIRIVVVDRQSPATVYTGTSGGGVFRSTDRGASWSAFNVGLGNRDVRALALSPSGVCLQAGTFGGGVFDFATQFDDPCAALSPPVAAAVLPSSRSVAVGTPATAFATIINPNDTAARSCGISLLTNDAATLSYQTTDPNTNQVVGTPNTPADIPPHGSQTYVIAVTATNNFNDVEMQFGFNCVGVAPAPNITGVNTLLLSAFEGPARPDIVALAASDGGIVNVSGPSLAGAFAVATINLGGDGTITASADTGGVSLPVVPLICETDPVTSICKDPPAPTVRRGINPGQTPTYGIFVMGTGGAVPFDPAVNRIFVRFKQIGTTSSVTRGSTSVAVRTR
jgi:photosystem II stability/assembly factor-like uncharacterized protein